VQTRASQVARPPLKWAGGKRQLLPALAPFYPERFDRYFEPFLGSGAVFFDLMAGGHLEGREARLSDVNLDLIGCYTALRDRPDAVIAALAELEQEYQAGGADCYYDVRDNRFNPRREAERRVGVAETPLSRPYPADLAAMLIFLNRTGFNGLFRVNRRGGFNVPAGRYHNPTICDGANLRAVSEAFRHPGVHLEYRRFDAVLAEAGRGDFVYCDPPYVPLSRTASFASYTADGFTALDQARLLKDVADACRRGAAVVVSNSSAEEVVAAYTSPAARQADMRLHRVPARRAINSRASSRGAVDELIITNVEAGPAIARMPHPPLRMARAARTERRTRTA